MLIVEGLSQGRAVLRERRVRQWTEVPPRVAQRISQVFGRELSAEEAVAEIVKDVRARGDAALKEYTQRIEGFALERIEIPATEAKKAWEALPEELAEALSVAAQRVWEFHSTTVPHTWVDFQRGLGELVIPLECVGAYVPGGTAAYPSSVLMSAIPARVAGVREIILCTPTLDGRLPAQSVLAAAHLAQVDRIFQVGGAQAIAAMAFGTETVPKVDKICGPGNIFVTLAKKAVFGQVGIDGLYGPTETVVVADGTANPVLCAADLLAQAEHDIMAFPIMLTISSALATKVLEEVKRQLAGLDRKAVAEVSLTNQGCMVIVDNLEEAFELANEIAPEHLCLLVEDPWSHLRKVRHAGGVFLGELSPEVMGDYVAGPSHTMPTGGTARFSSYLGVHHFVKMTSVVGISGDDLKALAQAACTIARAEGFTGHARAVEVRLEHMEKENNT